MQTMILPLVLTLKLRLVLFHPTDLEEKEVMIYIKSSNWKFHVRLK